MGLDDHVDRSAIFNNVNVNTLGKNNLVVGVFKWDGICSLRMYLREGVIPIAL